MNHGHQFDEACEQERRREQERKQKERETRKKLEAAAPDLLAACKDGLVQLSRLVDIAEIELPDATWDEEREAIHTMQQAITKAESEQADRPIGRKGWDEYERFFCWFNNRTMYRKRVFTCDGTD